MATTSGRSGIWIDGRRIVLATGPKSQTVNVCTPGNHPGNYEVKYRLPILSAVAAQDLSELTDLAALDDWLVDSRNALREDPSGKPTLSAVGIDAVDPAWLHDAVAMVEQAIDMVVDDFAVQPYRHRVEHSLHLQLYRAVAGYPELDVLTPIGASSLRAGLIHKEWPETVPAPDADQRGLFDLAVLAPSQLAQAGVEQFRQGRIHAPIVIEVGLDYGWLHLKQDLEKLHNSRVPHAYVVHFSRRPTSNNVEQLLTGGEYPGIRTAYAHIPSAGSKAIKHVADADLTWN